MSFLDRVRFVLVRPQHPGNIGAVARAMMTMGLHDLALVAPSKFPHPQADAMAAGAAGVLASARVYADLEAAVADCGRVAGASARRRALPLPTEAPREWAQRTAAGVVGRVAVVLGPERVGLDNDEVQRCHELICIPADPAYSSLNLGAAAQVLAYEIRLAAGEPAPAAPPHEPVPHAEMERLFEHLERLMIRTGFLDPAHPRQLMPRLRRLFGRAAPDENEMNILRGVLAAAESGLRPELKPEGDAATADAPPGRTPES